MNREKLKEIIREEILKEKKGSGFDEWSSKDEAKMIYNFYSSADVMVSNLDAFMDHFRSGKIDDAKRDANNVLDELKDIKKNITKVEKALRFGRAIGWREL